MIIDDLLRVVSLGSGVVLIIALLAFRSVITTTPNKDGTKSTVRKQVSPVIHFVGGLGAVTLLAVGIFGVVAVSEGLVFLVWVAIAIGVLAFLSL